VRWFLNFHHHDNAFHNSFFFSSRRRHTRWPRDWSSDVCFPIYIASHLARSGRYRAIACVGVVIRGQTPHFEHVAREAATGIREVALATGVPVTFGVITALSEEQAWDRAGGDVGNRGEEAAEAAVEMAEFIAKVHRG